MRLPNKRAGILLVFLVYCVWIWQRGWQTLTLMYCLKVYCGTPLGSQFVSRESFCIYLLPHTCIRRYINLYHEGTFLMQVTFREVRDGGWTGREGVFSKFLPSIFTSMFLQNKTALHQNAYFEIIWWTYKWKIHATISFFFFLHVSQIFEFIFSEFETLTNTWCCVVDVLALAASIGELTTLCRKARTANWCALQMADKDNAPLTSLGFEIKTEMTKEGFPVYISQQNVIELQDTEEGQSGENSKAWVTPASGERSQEWCHQQQLQSLYCWLL